MNYQAIHDAIIFMARSRQKPDEYCERHHVLPRSMGGTNVAENIVTLTAREHYLVHWLLYKIYRNKQMAFAWYRMTHGKQSIRRYTSRTFAYAVEARSLHMRGPAKPLSIEHRTKLSEAKKGLSYSDMGRGQSPLKGRPLSEEHRRRLSAVGIGRTHAFSFRNKVSQARGGGSGVVGVRRVKNRWRAEIYIDGKKRHLGSFLTIEEATAARHSAEQFLPD